MNCKLLPLLLLVTYYGLAACNSSGEQTKQDKDYEDKIEEWHRQRISSLKEDDSWLCLVGLYPLEKGSYTFGADSTSDIIFPPGKAPDKIGRINVENEKVDVLIDKGIVVLHNKKPVSQIELKNDEDGEPTVLSYNSLEWYIIERGDEIYLRLKDNNHPRLASFTGIERFPVSEQWRVRATFEAFDEAKSIGVPNVLGQVNEEPWFGILKFSVNGEEYQLAPLGDPDSDRFFIIFGDNTNGESTYGGGRFVYADTPDENAVTFIDFNKAYNPPCVFTEFATCPLPPSQNRLALKVTAGEKNYGQGH